MKFWKKILLILFAVILLAQIPFVYNRYKFGRLHDKINQLQTQRTEIADANFNDYKGVIHVHTTIGGHSTGSFDELIDGASKNNLDFVVMTEHTAALYDTSALTLQGDVGGVLFVNGQEVETATDRFLLLPGSAEAGKMNRVATPDFLRQIHEQNKLAFITYPEKHKTWDADFDGIEVFSLHTNAKKMSPFFVLFDAVWSYYSYPELVLAKYFYRPDANLKRFDEITQTRKSTLFAGTDAHSNIGFHLFGDDAGNKIINLKIDRYETIFRAMRNHVLIEKDKPLTTETLLQALKNGRLFVGLDVLSDTKGFSFTAENDAESKTMGDEIALAENLNLKIAAPQTARFAVFKNGEKIHEEKDALQINFHVKEKAAYRVEVYLDSLGAPFNQMPWIISNPIYVK
ncbi:MAG TPA: hypothetical protein VK308_00570 [Pyrinomonadaceae bacterium]|nr:hypothetical protein [Pyrinomonadaceae bacterium]